MVPPAMRGTPARTWPPLLFLLGLVVVLVGLSQVPSIYRGFVGPYIWRPLVRDEGFNVVNTGLLIVILVPLAVWIHRLAKRHEVRIDVMLVLAGLLLQPVGSMLRALEDSDFFAPYDEDLRAFRPDLGPGATCAAEIPGGPIHDCLGLAFITPLIYVWMVLLMGGLGRLAFAGHELQRHAGVGAATRFYLLTLVAGLSLYAAWHVSDPTYVRARVPAWFAVAAFAAPAATILFVRRRLGRHDWRAAFFAYTLVPFLITTYTVGTWLLGGVPGWRPGAQVDPWILVVGPSAALALTMAAAWQARLMTRKQPATMGLAASWWSLWLLLSLQGFGLFFGAVFLAQGQGEIFEGGLRVDGSWLAACLAILLLAWTVAARVGASWGAHASLRVLTQPMNLLLLGGQFLDALMTSIGLDAYGAQEKHVLPRTLVAWFDSLPMPALIEPFPTLFVFVPYKLGLTLLLIWALDVRYRQRFDQWPNASILIKGIAFLVGLSPGLRDAIRLSMGV